MDNDLVGQSKWLQRPDDDDLWILGTVEKQHKGDVHLLRGHTPAGPPGQPVSTKLVVSEAEFAKALPAVGVTDIEHAAECDDLVTLDDPQASALITLTLLLALITLTLLLAPVPSSRSPSCLPFSLAAHPLAHPATCILTS